MKLIDFSCVWLSKDGIGFDASNNPCCSDIDPWMTWESSLLNCSAVKVHSDMYSMMQSVGAGDSQPVSLIHFGARNDSAPQASGSACTSDGKIQKEDFGETFDVFSWLLNRQAHIHLIVDERLRYRFVGRPAFHASVLIYFILCPLRKRIFVMIMAEMR